MCLQGTAVTQTALGELSIYPRVANFLQYMYAQNNENRFDVCRSCGKRHF